MEDTSVTLHSKLIDYISGKLDPSLKEIWTTFTHSIISYHLGYVTLERCKSFHDVAEELMEESLIDVGRYDLLIEIFDSIKLIALKKTVKAKQKKIQAAIEKERKEKVLVEDDSAVDSDDTEGSEDNSLVLQVKLITHISRTLHPSRSNDWNKFIHSYLANKLTTHEIAKCTCFGDIFKHLKDKKCISIGDYQLLVDIFRSIELNMLSDEVDAYQTRIRAKMESEGNDAGIKGNNKMDKSPLTDERSDGKFSSHYLEANLIKHISGELSPTLVERWSMFIHSYLSSYLSSADIKQCNCFADVFDKLKARKVIDVGNYDFLVEVLSSIGLIKLRDEVKSFQRRIKDAWKNEKKENVTDEEEAEEIYSRSDTHVNEKHSMRLHAEMILYVGGELHPSLQDWRKFTHSIISSQLQQSDIAECKSFAEIFNKLLSKKLAEVGNYQFVWQALGSIELIKLRDEVKTYERRIKKELEKEKDDVASQEQDMEVVVDTRSNVMVKESTKLIAEMVRHAAGVIHPSIPHVWSCFTNSYVRSALENKMANCKFFEDVFNKLMEEKFIAVGNYEFLTGVLNSIGLIKLRDEVKSFENRIKDALEKEGQDPIAVERDSRDVKLSVRLQSEMMKRIDGKVCPSLSNWSQLKLYMFEHLTKAEIEQSKCFADVFYKLMGKNKIGHGEYSFLVQLFNNMQLIQLKIEVEKYQKKIKDAIEQEKEQKKKEAMSDRECPQAKKMKPDSKDQVDAAATRQENSRTSGSVQAYNSQEQNEQDKFGDQIEACIVKGNVKLEDIVGLKQMKKALYQAVILPQKHPEVFTGNLHPWKGILLFGPPGTGKSYLAKAAATDTKSTFFSISSADILSKWVGESGKMVKALFNKARERKPSIIFLDEVDGLCLSRHEHHAGANRQVITEFLKQMDGVGKEEMEGILVLGATNRPGDLDDAMLRRFQKRFYVTMPDAKARSELFKQHIGRPHSLRDDEFDVLGEQSEGYSGADIYNVGQDAMLIGVDKAEEAKYFVEISDQSRENPGRLDRFWTPCSPSTPGAKRMTFEDIPQNKFQRPKVTMEDVQKCLSQRKPSVNIESLKMFKEFDEKYGEQKRDGKAEETCREANVGAEEAACN